MSNINKIESSLRRSRIESVIGSVVCGSSGLSTVYTDGTTITGDGSASNPLVASAGASGLQAANNLSDVSSTITSLQNLGGLPRKYTVTDKSTSFQFTNSSDLTQVAKLFRCTASLTVTLDKDATSGLSTAETVWFMAMTGVTITFSAGAGASIESTSGSYTLVGPTGGVAVCCAIRRTTDTWTIVNGSPPASGFTSVTLLGFALALTNLASSFFEISSVAGRYRTKFDFTNYTQIRFWVGVSAAGTSTSGGYCQYSTDQSSWTDIGTGATTNLASFAAIGGAVSDWITIPAGMKSDVWIRALFGGGDGVADPAVGTFGFQVK